MGFPLFQTQLALGPSGWGWRWWNRRGVGELMILPLVDDVLPREQPILHGSSWIFIMFYVRFLSCPWILRLINCPWPCVLRTSQVLVPMRTQMPMAQMGFRRQRQVGGESSYVKTTWPRGTIWWNDMECKANIKVTSTATSSHTSIPIFLKITRLAVRFDLPFASHFC